MSGLCFLRWLYIFICSFQASQNVVTHPLKLVSNRQRESLNGSNCSWIGSYSRVFTWVFACNLNVNINIANKPCKDNNRGKHKKLQYVYGLPHRPALSILWFVFGNLLALEVNTIRWVMNNQNRLYQVQDYHPLPEKIKQDNFFFFF